MPFKVRIEGIFPDEDYPAKKINRALDKLKVWLISDAGKLLQRDFEDTTRGWSERPSFPVIYSEPYGTRMQIFISPKGRGTTNWIRVSKGTRSRAIYARRRKNMVFQPDYNPHTRPGGKWGGPGTYSGDTVRTPVVRGHSIAPRDFSKFIADKREDKLQRDAAGVVKRALR